MSYSKNIINWARKPQVAAVAGLFVSGAVVVASLSGGGQEAAASTSRLTAQESRESQAAELTAAEFARVIRSASVDSVNGDRVVGLDALTELSQDSGVLLASIRAAGESSRQTEQNNGSECEPGIDQSNGSVAVGWCTDAAATIQRSVDEAQREVDGIRSRPTPRRIVVTPPSYTPGRSATVTPPSVDVTPPTVSRSGESVTVTLPSAEVTPPTYTPGELGQLQQPSITIE